MEQTMDYLSADQPIPGQNYVCLSFISPEKVIRDRHIFYVQQFLKSIYKTPEIPSDQLETLTEEQREDIMKLRVQKMFEEGFSYESIEGAFQDFLVNNEETVGREFDATNDFRTSVRGLKVRGVFDTAAEARSRAERIRRRDPNFHVFVGQVGYWLPWDPNPENVQDQNYAESQLNELVHRYQENKERKDELFEMEKDEQRKAAIRENMRRKRELEEKMEGVEEQVRTKVNTDVDTSTTEQAEQELSTDTDALGKIEELREMANDRDRHLLDNEKPISQIVSEQSTTPEENAALMEGTDPWLARRQEQTSSSSTTEQTSSSSTTEQTSSSSTTEQTSSTEQTSTTETENQATGEVVDDITNNIF